MQRILLVHTAFLLPLLALELRWRGYRPASRTAARWARLCRIAHDPGEFAGQAADLPPEVCAQTVCAVESTAHRLPWPLKSPSCLARSLTLWCLLTGRGLDCDLRMGARCTADRLEAHAWVEYRGVVLNDTPDVRKRFPSLEPAANRL
jgi:hypothetical protein